MKTLKRTGLVFLSLIALLGIWIGVNSIDDRELSPEAQEMLKPFPEVPPEENGYTVLSYLNAGYKNFSYEALGSKFKDMIHGKYWNDKLAHKIIDDNQKVMDDVLLVIQKPRFKFPESNSALDLPSYSNYLKAGNLFGIAALIEAKQGNFDKSIQDLTTYISFCQKLEMDESNIMLSRFIAENCMFDAISILHKIDSTHGLASVDRASSEKLFTLIIPYQNDNFGKVFKGEFSFAYQNTLEYRNRPLTTRVHDSLSRESDIQKKTPWCGEACWGIFNAFDNVYWRFHAVDPDYYFLPNHSFSKLVPVYRQAEQDSPQFCNNIITTQQYGHHQWDEYHNPFIPARLKKPDWYFAEFFDRRCLAYTYYDAVKTIIALHAYEHDHQALPAQLSDLVPQYLDKLPVDYFDGQTLRYSPEHRWLYSVGTDFKDDKGSKEGFNKGTCYDAKDKQACNTNPTFPIDWNDYPASMK